MIVVTEKIRVTGKRNWNKGILPSLWLPGGSRFTKLSMMLEKQPDRVVEMAVRGMLQNKLGAQQYRKLNVYAGPEHPHAAQNQSIRNFHTII